MTSFTKKRTSSFQRTASMVAMESINNIRTGNVPTDSDRSAFCTGSNQATDGENDAFTTPDLSQSLKKATMVMQQHTVAHSSTLIERTVLEQIVSEHQERVRGFLIIIFSVVYFIVYCTSSLLHMDITDVFLMEEPLREALAPTLHDVMEVDDVWDWIQGTYMPIFFRQVDAYGNPLPPEEWSRIYMYNALEGAVVLEQWRGEEAECKFQLNNAQTRMCNPIAPLSSESFGLPFSELPQNVNWSSIVNSDTEGFVASQSGAGRRLRQAREEIQSWLPQFGTEDTSFKFFLLPNVPIETLHNRIEYLKYRMWLDKKTTYLAVKATVLNPEGDPRIDSVQIKFQFSRGGGVFHVLRFNTLPLVPIKGGMGSAFDVLFFVMVLVDQIWAIRGLVSAWRNRRAKQHALKASNAFALANVFLAWMVILGFAAQVALTADVNTKLEQLKSATTDRETEERAVELNDVTENTVFIVSWYYLLITYYSIFLMFRLFASLENQPRLAVVINTLKATTVDLFHFLIIFIPTFIAFAIAGMVVFGRRVDEFSSLTRSVGTCYKIAIENEFEWDTLSEENFAVAATWVWSYLVLICLVLLNMVLAIIMDVYTEMRLGSDFDETIWENIKFGFTWLRGRLKGKQFLGDEKVLAGLQELPPVITERELCEKFPDMIPLQRNYLVKNAKERQMSVMRIESRSSSANDMSAAIKLGLDKVCQLLEQKRKRRAQKQMQGSRSNRTCIEDIMQSMAVQNHWMTTIQTQLATMRRSISALEGSADLFGEHAVDVDEPIWG